MLLFLLLSAQDVVPASLEPTRTDQLWLQETDYPRSEIDAGRGGVVTVKVIIAPTGIPEQCLVVSGSGNQAINDMVCKVSMKRLRFKPPVSALGQPAYAIWQKRAILLPPDSSYRGEEMPSNFKIRADLPAGFKKPANIETLVSVNEAGDYIGCSARYAKSDTALVRLACDAIKTRWQPAQEKNAGGKPITYVTWAKVLFAKPEAR